MKKSQLAPDYPERKPTQKQEQLSYNFAIDVYKTVKYHLENKKHNL